MKKIYRAALATALSFGLVASGAAAANAAPNNLSYQAPNETITHITDDYRCTTSFETTMNAGWKQMRTRLSCSRINPGVELRAGALLEGYKGGPAVMADSKIAFTKWIGTNDYAYVFYSGWETVGLGSSNPPVLHTFIEKK